MAVRSSRSLVVALVTALAAITTATPASSVGPAQATPEPDRVSAFYLDGSDVQVDDHDGRILVRTNSGSDLYTPTGDGEYQVTRTDAKLLGPDGTLVDEGVAVGPDGTVVSFERPLDRDESSRINITGPGGASTYLVDPIVPFCSSNAVDFDGPDRLAVGCVGVRSSAARVLIFERAPSGRFERSQTIAAPTEGVSGGRFGNVLAFTESGTLFVGDPTWNATPYTGENLGSFDEDVRDEAGAVYRFERGRSGAYEQTARLSEPGVRFGLAIDTVGNDLLVTTVSNRNIYRLTADSTERYTATRIAGPPDGFAIAYAQIQGLSDGRFVVRTGDRVLLYDPSDTARPAVPRPKVQVVDLVDAARADDRSLTLSWGEAADDGTIAAYELYFNGNAGGLVVTGRSFTINGGSLLRGELRVWVRAIDSGGNRSWRTGTTTVTFTGDTERPTPPGAPRREVSQDNPGIVRFVFRQATDNVRVRRYELFAADKSRLVPFCCFARFDLPDGRSVIAVNADLLPPPPYGVFVRAYDDAGNESWRSGITQFND